MANEDAISGFKAVGVDTVPVDSKKDCEEKINNIYNSDEYGIIFITEDWVDKIQLFLNELPLKALPSIVAIPSQAGSTGAGLANLRKIVEKAVGSDILSN